MKKALIVCGALFLCAMALTGCGGDASPPPPAQEGEANVPEEPLSVGRSASLENGLLVTVSSARSINRDPEAKGDQPGPGEVWTVVDFTVENTGRRPLVVTPANWSAIADVGDFLSQVPEAVPDEEASKVDWAGELEAGQKREGFVVFVTLLSDRVFLQFTQASGEAAVLAEWELGQIRKLETMRL